MCSPLMAFPYGSFHRSVVKDNVYKPDWRTSERVEYTLRLCKILVSLAPGGHGWWHINVAPFLQTLAKIR